MVTEVDNILKLPRDNYFSAKVEGKHICRDNLPQVKAAVKHLPELTNLSGEAILEFAMSFKGKIQIGQRLGVYAVKVKNKENTYLLFGATV